MEEEAAANIELTIAVRRYCCGMEKKEIKARMFF
jgi:hypothetical protein